MASNAVVGIFLASFCSIKQEITHVVGIFIANSCSIKEKSYKASVAKLLSFYAFDD